MKGSRPPALLSLIDRSRNILWLQRLVHSLWPGCCIAAVALLLLAVAHVTLAPVPVSVWLPCTLAPPLLAALWVALWRRPSAAGAAAELDRRGAYDDLLVTAWELLATPPLHRPAGADVVLQRASDLCPGIQLPPVGAERSAWRGRFAAVPLTLLLVALFLLQLPSSRQPAWPQHHSIAGTTTGGDRRQPATAAGGNSEGPQTAAATTTNAPLSRPPAVAAAPERAAPAQGIPPMAATPASPGNVIDQPGALPATPTRKTAGSGNTDQDGAAPLTDQGRAAGGEIAVHYQDIARDIPAAGEQAIAGTGSAGLTDARIAQTDAVPPNHANISAQRLPAPYANRFSLSQRVQISAYFDRLEEMR